MVTFNDDDGLMPTALKVLVFQGCCDHREMREVLVHVVFRRNSLSRELNIIIGQMHVGQLSGYI